MKIERRTKIFLIIFFSIILISAIIIGTMNYTKEKKIKNRIENSKTTRILTLNNISTAITLEELLEIETSKEYIIDNDVSVNDEEMKIIKYTNTNFCGVDCKKEYIFYDNQLGICIFDIDSSHWMSKDIYEELVKLNGEPDEVDIESNKYHHDMYTWHGKNGTIVYTDDNINNTIEIILEIKE